MIGAIAVIVAAAITAGGAVWASRIARDVRQIRVSVNGRLDRLLAELRDFEAEEGIDPNRLPHGPGSDEYP